MWPSVSWGDIMTSEPPVAILVCCASERLNDEGVDVGTLDGWVTVEYSGDESRTTCFLSGRSLRWCLVQGPPKVCPCNASVEENAKSKAIKVLRRKAKNVILFSRSNKMGSNILCEKRSGSKLQARPHRFGFRLLVRKWLIRGKASSSSSSCGLASVSYYCKLDHASEALMLMKIMESLEGLLDDALGGGDAKHTLWLWPSNVHHIGPKDAVTWTMHMWGPC